MDVRWNSVCAPPDTHVHRKLTENGVLARTLTGAAAGGRSASITDPEKLQEALKTSYANLQKAIEGLSDADLKLR
jgi:galactokinase